MTIGTEPLIYSLVCSYKIKRRVATLSPRGNVCSPMPATRNQFARCSCLLVMIRSPLQVKLEIPGNEVWKRNQCRERDTLMTAYIITSIRCCDDIVQVLFTWSFGGCRSGLVVVSAISRF